jgi:hypothetical protein
MDRQNKGRFKEYIGNEKCKKLRNSIKKKDRV